MIHSAGKDDVGDARSLVGDARSLVGGARSLVGDARSLVGDIGMQRMISLPPGDIRMQREGIVRPY